MKLWIFIGYTGPRKIYLFHPENIPLESIFPYLPNIFSLLFFLAVRFPRAIIVQARIKIRAVRTNFEQFTFNPFRLRIIDRQYFSNEKLKFNYSPPCLNTSYFNEYFSRRQLYVIIRINCLLKNSRYTKLICLNTFNISFEFHIKRKEYKSTKIHLYCRSAYYNSNLQCKFIIRIGLIAVCSISYSVEREEKRERVNAA